MKTLYKDVRKNNWHFINHMDYFLLYFYENFFKIQIIFPKKKHLVILKETILYFFTTNLWRNIWFFINFIHVSQLRGNILDRCMARHGDGCRQGGDEDNCKFCSLGYYPCLSGAADASGNYTLCFQGTIINEWETSTAYSWRAIL